MGVLQQVRRLFAGEAIGLRSWMVFAGHDAFKLAPFPRRAQPLKAQERIWKEKKGADKIKKGSVLEK
jgi:hypothetical protein